MKRLLANRDLIAGLLFLAVSIVFLDRALALRLGRATEMGPGYFPTILASILLLLSILLLAKALIGERVALGRVETRSLAMVTAGIVLFGLTVRDVGLISATVAVVVVSSFASRDCSWRNIALLTAGLCGFAVLVFVKLLKLPLSL